MQIFKVLGGLTVLVIVSYLGFVGYITFEPNLKNYRARVEFNSELWKSWEETESNVSLRWDMTHDLATNYNLIGKSPKQIIELLGKPSSQSNSELRYYLGMSRKGIDTGSLILVLEKGKVVNYKIWHG
ncbi:hypothetical protein [Reichenbachiella ulvae]|uniref:Beta-lactamase-inhibitor-like, PepSY-like n=1 Tax=Reichenbachiella ulvae TaxID=2980104 RepID=A0ABT3CP38_9BACT|nr:hypothetical protein [Reichenbachiella ulvae]MCV9385503.1 hypothetical protein [Reichenbachiella ulvae]